MTESEMDPPKCSGCDLRVCRCDEPEMKKKAMQEMDLDFDDVLTLSPREREMKREAIEAFEEPETYDCEICRKVGHGCLTVASALGSDVHSPPQTLPPGWLRWAGFYACSRKCAIMVWTRENQEK